MYKQEYILAYIDSYICDQKNITAKQDKMLAKK